MTPEDFSTYSWLQTAGFLGTDTAENSRPCLNRFYRSFNIFLLFWLAKSASIIHHNRLLLTKFGRILRLIKRWRQKFSTVAGLCTVDREDLGTRLSCFGCEKKNGRKMVGGTFYSFHDELLSKNIARRLLDGQHLVFGVYLQTWTALHLLNMQYRGELNIDEGKHVLASFWARNYFEWIIKKFMDSAFVGYWTIILWNRGV